MPDENTKPTTKRPNTRSLINESHIIESPFKSMQLMDKRFDRLTHELTETIRETISSEVKKIEQKILADFNIKFANMKDELSKQINETLQVLRNEITTVTQRVDSIEKQCSDIEKIQCELANMNSVISTLNSKLLRHENSLIACDLRITGIPWYQDENLADIFGNICNMLNIEMPYYRNLFRTRSKNNSPDSAILVKLESPMAKVHLLKSINGYRKNNNNAQLYLHLIGINSDRIFHVNESLSQSNYIIFQNALRYRKEKKLVNGFTRRGVVNVVISAKDKPIQIYSLDDLHDLFRS